MSNNEPIVPSIKEVRPCGSQVLVELLTAQEVLNTRLSVGNRRATEEYQGYVRAVGPSLKPKDWGFKVGDRVVLSGMGVPAPSPKAKEGERERVLMEPHSIRAVLVEG
jgi:hypothetical protein